MTVAYLAWQDQDSRTWFPVGQLSRNGDGYRFVYTRGADQADRFSGFPGMPLRKVYLSESLPALFQNRLMSKGRPEYRELLSWVDMDHDTPDPLRLLVRTEGVRSTDSLMVFEKPEPADGMYRVTFFVHGGKYMQSHDAILESTEAGNRLFPMLDEQNPKDPRAIALRAESPTGMVGYVPRFLCEDFRFLLAHGKADLKITAKKVNHGAPSQYKLLGEAVSLWPSDFDPCATEQFQELI